MTIVSARSYVAAGLATAIAGVAVASPMLAQSQIHLPTVSGNVDLASEVSSVTKHAVNTGTIEVKQIGDAVLHVMVSAPHEAATAATTLPGGPLVKQAAATAMARAVTAVIAANQASSITVHRDSAASPAVSAALPGLQSILGIPLLVADIPVDIAQAAVKGVNEATRGLSNVLFGLGTGDQATVQFGISQITSAIPDAINRAARFVAADVGAIETALGFGPMAVDSAALAGVAKMADAKNPDAVAVAPKSLNPPKPAAPTKADPTKADPTKADPTKGTHPTKGTDATKGTDSTKGDATADATKGTDTTKPDTTKPSDHSSTAEHHNAPSTANATAANKGATKAGASAHNGHTAGAASHPGGSAAKHSAGAGAGAGAKKGGAKGGK